MSGKAPVDGRWPGSRGVLLIAQALEAGGFGERHTREAVEVAGGRASLSIDDLRFAIYERVLPCAGAGGTVRLNDLKAQYCAARALAEVVESADADEGFHFLVGGCTPRKKWARR